jgi:hypothetical protein
MTTFTAHIYSINPDNGTKVASGATRDEVTRAARAWVRRTNRTAEIRQNGKALARVAINGAVLDVAK